MNGMPTTVWFDRKQISPFCEEDLGSMKEACDSIGELVDAEVKNGIARNRIIVGMSWHDYYK